MSGSLEHLVRMANQIARNLEHEPDPAAATAEHIQLYWDPRMKLMIFENGAAGLSEIAAAAISALKARV